MAAVPANRDEQGRFPKGVSGNPTGRPKKAAELSRAVRDLVDATDLADGFWTIAQGLPLNGLEPKLAEVLEARKWLADRGWGKAVDLKPLDDEDPLGEREQEVRRAADEFTAEVVRLASARETREHVGAASNGSRSNGQGAQS